MSGKRKTKINSGNIRIGIYPGTFDPITYGHIDLINRAEKLVDILIIVVAKDITKKTFFTFNERVNLIKKVIKKDNSVLIKGFEGLLIDFAIKNKANIIIRGLRAVSDFEYELKMAMMNKNLNKNIETIFLMAEDRYSFISSSLVKEVFLLNANIEKFVPEEVVQAMKNKKKEIRKQIKK